MNPTEYRTAVTQYIAGLPSLKKSAATIRKYEYVLKLFGEYLERIGKDCEIMPIDIINWRTEIATSGIRSNSVKHYIIVLNTFFSWGVKVKLCDENPIDRHEKPKQQDITYHILTLDEIQTILYAKPTRMAGKNYIRNRAIITLLILTGLRNSELRLLRIGDLNFENGVITVARGKGNKRREIAFPELARERVAEWLTSQGKNHQLNGNELVFPNAEQLCDGEQLQNPLSAVSLQKMVRNYVKGILGYTDIHPHTLRHCACSLWDYCGVPIRTVSANLGHASVRTTESVYLHVLDKSQAARTVNAALDATLSSMTMQVR